MRSDLGSRWTAGIRSAWKRDEFPTEKQNGLATFAANPLFYMARPAGFEPTTPWFVAKYSIQLSYGRIFSILSQLFGLGPDRKDVPKSCVGW